MSDIITYLSKNNKLGKDILEILLNNLQQKVLVQEVDQQLKKYIEI